MRVKVIHDPQAKPTEAPSNVMHNQKTTKPAAGGRQQQPDRLRG